jgi:hypothetical protein
MTKPLISRALITVTTSTFVSWSVARKVRNVLKNSDADAKLISSEGNCERRTGDSPDEATHHGERALDAPVGPCLQ